jgi:hypothetical protein
MADDGKFLARPDGAAPLFDSKSGKAAARKRWDRDLTGNVPALKFLTQKLDLVPVGGAEPTTPTSQTNQQFNVYNFGTPKQAEEFANQLEEAGEIVLAAMVRAQINEDEDAQVIEVLVD